MAIRKVELWNDGVKDYSEKFRGEMLTIPARSHIVMEDPDASQFMGQMVPFRKDGQGNQLTEKRLRKVYITEATEAAKTKCMLCSKEFKTPTELEVHAVEHAHAMVDEKAKEAATKKSKFFS